MIVSGEPPGEFIINATAGLFLLEKSFSMSFSKESKVMPDRDNPALPIIPESLSVGIIVEFPKSDLNIIPIIKSYTIEKVFSMN